MKQEIDQCFQTSLVLCQVGDLMVWAFIIVWGLYRMMHTNMVKGVRQYDVWDDQLRADGKGRRHHDASSPPDSLMSGMATSVHDDDDMAQNRQTACMLSKNAIVPHTLRYSMLHYVCSMRQIVCNTEPSESYVMPPALYFCHLLLLHQDVSV